MNGNCTKLRKKLRSYRTARFGALFLSGMILLAIVLTWVTKSNNANIAGIYVIAVLWPAVACLCHLKMKAITAELSELEDRSNS